MAAAAAVAAAAAKTRVGNHDPHRPKGRRQGLVEPQRIQAQASRQQGLHPTALAANCSFVAAGVAAGAMTPGFAASALEVHDEDHVVVVVVVVEVDAAAVAVDGGTAVDGCTLVRRLLAQRWALCEHPNLPVSTYAQGFAGRSGTACHARFADDSILGLLACR